MILKNKGKKEARKPDTIKAWDRRKKKPAAAICYYNTLDRKIHYIYL